MIMTILGVAGAVTLSQAAVPAAPAERALKDLPKTTVTYYDVAGRDGDTIEKSLKKLLSDPKMKDTVQLFTWNVDAEITKHTVNDKCTIQGAKSAMTASVHLPRLAEEAKVPKELMTNWRPYVSGLESEAAANLWFINDQLRPLEQSLAGKGCDQAGPLWNAGLEKIMQQQSAFADQRSKAAAKKAKK